MPSKKMKEEASLEIILEIEAYALKDLDDVATQLLMKLPDNGVVALHGAMGVGKTTLALSATTGSLPIW